MKRILLCVVVGLLSGCSDVSPLLNQVDAVLNNLNTSMNSGSLASNNLNGAVIRISGGPTIRVKNSGATINGEPTVEFRCILSGGTLCLSGFYVIDSGRHGGLRHLFPAQRGRGGGECYPCHSRGC